MPPAQNTGNNFLVPGHKVENLAKKAIDGPNRCNEAIYNQVRSLTHGRKWIQY
jgi:hypothetical protein